MVRVAAGGESGDLGVDVRAAPLRALQLLQDEDGRALAEDEAVAGPVERPGGGVRGRRCAGVVAWMASKQAEVIGEIGASVAPAIMTSAVPSRISSTAWPSESSPEVQPVETTAAGPSAPAVQATSAAMRAGHEVAVQLGYAYSWSTFHFRPPSLTTAYSRSRLVVQPTALPTAVPMRPGRGRRCPGRCRRGPHGWRRRRTARPGRACGSPAG